MPIFRLETKSVLFAHIPKTAGSSIEDLFSELGWQTTELDRYEGVLSANHLRRCSPQHMHADLLESIYRVEKFDFSFAVVRHPVDRALSEFGFRNGQKLHGDVHENEVSTWWMAQKSELKRNSFHLDNHLRHQHEFVLENMEIYKYEEDLGRLHSKIISLTRAEKSLDYEPEMPHVNKSANSNNRIQISRQISKNVARYYRRDMKLFGYK